MIDAPDHPFAPILPGREAKVFFYRYRARLGWAFVLTWLAFVVLSFVPTPRYIATSVLIIRMGSEYVYQPESGNSEHVPTANIPFDRDQIYKAETAILSSEDLHQKVIESIGLEKLYPSLVEANVLTPILDWGTNLLIDWDGLMRRLPAEIDAGRMTAALKQFDKRLDILLEKESAVIDLSFGHPDAALSKQVLDTLLQLYFDKRRQVYLEPRAVLAATQTEALHEKALAAQQGLNDFKRAHHIYSLSDQRAALLQSRDDVIKKLQVYNNPGLETEVRDYNQQLDALDDLERDLNNHVHEVQIAQDEYALFAHKLDEALAFEAIERERSGGVRVIQAPAAPAEPFRLQPYIILVGAFMAVLAVIMTALVAEYGQRGFLTPEKLQRQIGLPVLAVFSWQDTAQIP